MCCCFNNSCLQKLFYLLVNDNYLSCIEIVFPGNHGLLWIVNKLNFDSLCRTEYTLVRSYALPYRNKLFQSTSNIWYINWTVMIIIIRKTHLWKCRWSWSLAKVSVDLVCPSFWGPGLISSLAPYISIKKAIMCILCTSRPILKSW